MNIAEVAHITSTVRPPQTPQPARTSQKKAFGSSARFDTGQMVEVLRREDCPIDVRLSIITTTVHTAHTPQSARTSQKHARGSSAYFVKLAVGWRSGGKVPDMHPISLVAGPLPQHKMIF